MGVLGTAVDLQKHHRYPGLRCAHHQVRALHVSVAKPMRDLGGETEQMTDPSTVEFNGRRGKRRCVVVAADAEQLPGVRGVPLLAQCRDAHALGLQRLLRFGAPPLRRRPRLSLVLP
ncbi:hypothetical protein ACIGW0_23035 [Streptomyces bikiniensis]|uniref:Uncharacterized protein n=1 Tax=Streptomyces bikiniensis TaxID=1896 RepID=A0ABW8CXD2_STRBI